MARGTTRRTGELIELPDDAGWTEYSPGTEKRCQVLLREDAGRFTATAITLLGVSASGTTEKDALEAIRKELISVLSKYKAAGDAIPWIAASDQQPGAKIRWVFISL